MRRVRWLMLISGITLFIIASLRGEIMDAVIAFGTAAVLGFWIDVVGIKVLALWSYPRQPFPGIKYFGLVVPSWGVFGTLINLSWEWSAAPWWSGLIAITLCLLLFMELSNILTKSWEYEVPKWLVFIGWFP